MPRPRHEEVMGRGPTGTESHGFRMSGRIAGAATAAQQSVSIAPPSARSPYPRIPYEKEYLPCHRRSQPPAIIPCSGS